MYACRLEGLIALHRVMVGHSYDIAVADYVSVVILSLRLLDGVSCDETKWSFVPDLWFRPFYVTNARIILALVLPTGKLVYRIKRVYSSLVHVLFLRAVRVDVSNLEIGFVTGLDSELRLALFNF